MMYTVDEEECSQVYIKRVYKSESNQCLTIKDQRQSSWFLFNIQMLISTRIKIKQGMVISVVVMNVIVLFCLPIRQLLTTSRQRRHFEHHFGMHLKT